ncbi:MAG: Ig-like domain-containing protein, partial [Gemmatimonadaceae bacterium]|nr:Ig-like domain-containing protein [Gemmatimonadaceae bacterium]
MRAFAPIDSLRRVARATPSWMPAVLALAVLASCDLNPNPEACSVTIAPSIITVPVNGAVTVTGTAFKCDGTSIRDKTINFSSANTSIATVTTSGQVVGVAVGTTTVSAVANGKQGTAQVTVTPEVATTVTVSPSTTTLRITNTRQFTATPKNAAGVAITGKTIRWSSSNSSIASVDQTGLVTALTPGTVIIAADADGVIGNASLTITNLPIGSCSLSPATQRVTVTAQAQPVITLRDTANNVLPTLGRPLSWSSDNEVVATVSGTGVIRAVRAGTARITAVPTEYPDKSCSTVFEAVDARIVSAVITPRSGSLRLGVQRQLNLSLTDSIGQAIPPGRVVTWTSATPATATVSATGLVTGLSLGTARIAVRADNAVDTVTFPVTKVPVTTVRLSPLSSSVVQGQTVQINPTVEDSTGATVTDRVIEWTSSDPTRATVSSTGLVSTTASGAVTITATSETRSGTATVNIQPIPVDTIVVDSTYSVVTTAVSKTFAITLKDAAGNQLFNRTVSVTSATPGIAQGTANSAGKIVTVTTFNVAGTAIFTLRALNAN